MRGALKGLAAVVAVLCAMASVCAAARDLKAAYVNGFRVENESAAALRAFEALRREFAPREKGLAQLEKKIAEARAELDRDAGTLSPAARAGRQRELAALAGRLRNAQQNFSEDLESRRREEHARVIAEADAAIRAVAEAGGYDLVVQDAAYSSPRADITARVLEEMKKRAAPLR